MLPALDDARPQVASGAAGGPVAASVARFVAAYGALTDGIGSGVKALGTLARVTGEDIAAATSGAPHIRRPGQELP